MKVGKIMVMHRIYMFIRYQHK